MPSLLSRIPAKIRRNLATRFERRLLPVATSRPLISFTFDDAPASAFVVGGDILRAHGGAATYFLSLGLLGTTTEVGPIADPGHLLRAREDGHELACHTYDHLDAWYSSRSEYLASVDRNRETLETLVPGAVFRSFAYPKSGPTVWVKGELARRFEACRGGGQCANIGRVDLNLVKACFLDRRTGIDLDTARTLIDRNAEARGWLVFATHDVAEDPSPYGCNTRFFEQTVDHAVRSGALIVPFAEACSKLRGTA
jgi:peptidoglycan/xylan/chitin deacetylase (PgdA/CDA1 family)